MILQLNLDYFKMLSLFLIANSFSYLPKLSILIVRDGSADCALRYSVSRQGQIKILAFLSRMGVLRGLISRAATYVVIAMPSLTTPAPLAAQAPSPRLQPPVPSRPKIEALPYLIFLLYIRLNDRGSLPISITPFAMSSDHSWL